MNITEIKIKFVAGREDKLKAFCSITIDREFVVRDIKIIESPKGYFVAMPSRKLMDKCTHCGGKNHMRAAYCNDCGKQLTRNRVELDETGRPKLHADIAHPINAACREKLQRFIIREYEDELARSKQPGYVPSTASDADFDNGYDVRHPQPHPHHPTEQSQQDSVSDIQ